jgi:hypothetical protein
LKTKSWLDEQRANTSPTLYEVLSAILNPGAEQSQYRKLADLKLAAKTLVFIQENNISDLPALADKVGAMHGAYTALNTNTKKINKRIDTLKEHLRQSENYKQYRRIAAEYATLSNVDVPQRKLQDCLQNLKQKKRGNRHRIITATTDTKAECSATLKNTCTEFYNRGSTRRSCRQ